MHYYAVITSDYCKQAEMALASFFNYNDVILNLYVVDSDYDKVCNNFKAKYTKDRFKLNNSFTDEMFKRIDADWNNYLIPEQDIYNELASDRIAISESIVSPCSVENDTNLTDVKAIHYNGLMKPWVDNSSIALDHFPITASYLLCEVFAKNVTIGVGLTVKDDANFANITASYITGLFT